MVLLDNGSEFMVGSGLIIGEAIKPSDDTPAGDAEA